MSKVTIDQVAEALKRHREITPAVLREIVEELNAAVEPDAENETAPRAKQQYVIVTTGDEHGWVLQLNETDAPHSVVDRIHQAAHAFNTTKKGRLLPVGTLGEALENVKRKQFKEAGVKVCTKLAVLIIETVNKLPEAPSV